MKVHVVLVDPYDAGLVNVNVLADPLDHVSKLGHAGDVFVSSEEPLAIESLEATPDSFFMEMSGENEVEKVKEKERLTLRVEGR